MKIGIITLRLHTNYGGLLQAYALQTILERMGHKVEVLTRSNKLYIPTWKKPIAYIVRTIYKYILKRKNTIIRREAKHNHAFPIISQYTQRFINMHIHARIIEDLSYVKEHEYNAFVVGSDQVWRPRYNRKIEDAFLDFAKDWNEIKRIAYAPSFGTEKWEYTPEQTERCKSLIKKFDAISVRESSGIDLCKKYLDAEAILVLDPTLLLDKEDYLNVIQSMDSPYGTRHILMEYVLDMNKEKEELVNTLAKNKQLDIIHANSKADIPTAPISERIQPPVENWLYGFKDAEVIVTDSFHACVFSIIFNKPFIVYGNKDRGYARFESLLGLFNLRDRLVTNSSEALEIINRPIDWQSVNEKREKLKTMSLNYLKANL